MIRYTTYCTPEQTKKSLELGAPIKFKTLCHYELQDGKFMPYPDLDIDINGDPILISPTTEEMIGWLEEQGVIDFYADRDLDEELNYIDTYGYVVAFSDKDRLVGAGITSRKEAILAAIDAALDYFVSKKGEK